MKELVLTYEDTDQLKLVVESTYFIKGDKGRKGKNVDCLTVAQNSMMYTVLNGLSEPRVKIKNQKILGTLTCEVVPYNNSFTLRPASEICVKQHKKYSFY
jgi:hypothetical protein